MMEESQVLVFQCVYLFGSLEALLHKVAGFWGTFHRSPKLDFVHMPVVQFLKCMS